jgi:hypothetical protein
VNGHIRPKCEWQGEDKHLDCTLPRRKKGAFPKKKRPIVAEPPAELQNTDTDKSCASESERNTDRAAVPAMWALKTFRYYLQGHKCILRTDHANVRWWKTMETGMPDVVRRWLLHISTYDVEIEYRPGRLHGNADGLFCSPIIEDCQARGCICTQARENAFQDDREPDFESHPGIEVVPTTLIAAVTSSGRNTVPETPVEIDEGEMDCSDVGILEPPEGFRHAEVVPPEELQDDDVSCSSSSDLEDLGAEEDILADIAPVGGWCSPAMKKLQSDDIEIARVRAWVEHGT